MNASISLMHADAFHALGCLPAGFADLIITDPPYNCYEEKIRRMFKSAKTRHSSVGSVDEKIDFDAYAHAVYRSLKDDSHAYTFMDHTQVPALRAAMRRAGFKYLQEMFWFKGSGTMDLSFGHRHFTSHEGLLFCHKGKKRLYHQLLTGLFCERPTQRAHPTQKPVDLLRQLITASSLPGDLVLDPFMGSGTTVYAAYTMGRRAVGIEMDPKYYAVAQRMCDQQTLQVLA